MTLKYIWRSLSLGCHFHVHFSYPWHAFASHGLPAIGEVLVLPLIHVGYAYLYLFSHCCLRKPQHTGARLASPKAEFNAKWTLRVIHGHLLLGQWKAIETTYKTIIFCLILEATKDMPTKSTANRHYRQPLTSDAFCSGNRSKYLLQSPQATIMLFIM